eukprot:10179760-Karenia_brevis.AAC.1
MSSISSVLSGLLRVYFRIAFQEVCKRRCNCASEGTQGQVDQIPREGHRGAGLTPSPASLYTSGGNRSWRG